MNEILLFVQGLVCAGLVFLAWRLDRDRLYAVIIIFLILISISGGKVVEFFGHETNTGNIPYASVYLATYFLIERYGRREGMHSLWVGILGIVFFLVLARLSIAFVGSQNTISFNDALQTALAPTSRIALASLVAYVCSQTFNVTLYVYLKMHMRHIGLWLRANAANLFAQILDSAIFFLIAFWGIVNTSAVLDAMLTGIVIKVIFIAVSSPLLYANGFEEETGSEYTSITWR